MSKTPLLITKESVKNDPALQKGARGARKIGVTTLYEQKEYPYSESNWYGSETATPVIELKSTELAVFNDVTEQDRHFHKNAHEFYTVLEGVFKIEVEEEYYTLNQGDTILVPPYAVHEVLRETSFTAQVITINCSGLEDKYTL